MTPSRRYALLGGLSALLGYLLADGRVPTTWSYHDWLKLAALAVLWCMKSPLSGAPTTPMVDLTKVGKP